MAAAAGGGAIAGLTALAPHLGPRWQPTAWRERVVPSTPSTRVGQAPAPTYRVHQELVTVPLDGADVNVAITRPDAPGRFPVLLFIHGAGTGHHIRYEEHARYLAARGIACVVPDKRLDTYSTASRDYVAMARDYLVSLRWARERPWADGGRTGVLGESEGGWIAPIAAALEPQCSFVVLVSSPVVRPREQMLYAAGNYLHNTDVPAPLYDVLPRVIGSDLGIGYGDFDSSAYQRQVSAPLLIVFGTADASMPVEQGVRDLLADHRAAGGRHALVRYYANANHSLLVGEQERLSHDFLSDLAAFVLDPVGACETGPLVAGSMPAQLIEATAAPHVPAIGQAKTQGLIAAGGAAAAIGGLVVAAASRRDARSLDRVWPLSALTGLTLGVAGSYVGRVASLALNYRRDPRVVRVGYQLTAASAAALAAVGAGRLVVCATSGTTPRRVAGVLSGAGALALAEVLAYAGFFAPRRSRRRAVWPEQ